MDYLCVCVCVCACVRMVHWSSSPNGWIMCVCVRVRVRVCVCMVHWSSSPNGWITCVCGREGPLIIWLTQLLGRLSPPWLPETGYAITAGPPGCRKPSVVKQRHQAWHSKPTFNLTFIPEMAKHKFALLPAKLEVWA